MNQVTVIGGVAFEICGIPKDICRLRNSNPGKVRITVSGIGHNIAKFLKGEDLEKIIYNKEVIGKLKK